MKIYNDNISIECDDIIPKKFGKMVYYYANENKINDTMNISFVCSCGKEVITNVKLYKKDSRLLCKACKTKETNLKNYGDKNYYNIAKAKETNLIKYGVDNPAKTKKVKDAISIKNKENAETALLKRRKTNLEKYGVKYSFESNEVKNKIKETNLRKYGGHPMQNDDIKNKSIRNHNIGYIEKLRERNDIEPLFDIDTYQGFDIEYDWKCKKCSNIFQSKIYTGYVKKCPICYPNLSGYSNIEKQIVSYIKSLNIQVVENTNNIISPYELDIYIPSHNLAIELDGLYWHSELQGKDKDYHLNKTIECEKLGITLLHIFEDEWLDKQDMIKNIINIKLGIISTKIMARKCLLRELESKDTKDFLNENHIQGYISAKINIGLYYDSGLVSLLTFGKPRFNKNYDWEILRYINKQGVSITGGFTRMLKYFIKNYKGKIITYSDRRLFDGDIYSSNGFTKLDPSKPSYYYTDGKQHRFSRQKFMKHKLKEQLAYFNSEMTEWENMQLNGWDRIYDCGNNVYTLT